MNIADDVGYGTVKGMTDRGNRLLEPSLVAQLPHDQELRSALGRNLLAKRVMVSDMTTNAVTELLIGKDAARELNPIRPFGNRLQGQDARNLLATTMAMLGAQGGVRLATGLPIAAYPHQRKALLESLKGSRFVVQVGETITTTFTIEVVVILPEGAAAYFAYNLTGRVGIIDIGYRTTDFLVVDNGQPMASGSVEIGGFHIRNLLGEVLMQKHGIPLDMAEIERAMGEGCITNQGEKIPVITLTESIRKMVAGRIREQLSLSWAGVLHRLDKVVVIGGEGKNFFPYLEGLHKQMFLPENPQFANVEGMLKALMHASANGVI